MSKTGCVAAMLLFLAGCVGSAEPLTECVKPLMVPCQVGGTGPFPGPHLAMCEVDQVPPESGVPEYCP